jgi:FemAB family protein
MIFNSSAQIKFFDRKKDIKNWNEILKKLKHVSVFYENYMIDYQTEYQKIKNRNFEDESLTIYFNDMPMGIWPITRDVKTFKLESFGFKMFPPSLIVETNYKQEKKILKYCYEQLVQYLKKNKILDIEMEELFSENISISYWHRLVKLNYGTSKVNYKIYLNLCQSVDEIKKNIRKRFIPLINKNSNMKFVIVNKNLKNLSKWWSEFLNFHIEISGKDEKTQNCWDLLLESIKIDKSFIVLSINSDNKINGAVMILTSLHEGAYGIGKFIHDDKSSYALFFEAIKELKKRNKKWFLIGHRKFSEKKIIDNDLKKKINLSYFKEGFASHIFAEYNFKINI